MYFLKIFSISILVAIATCQPTPEEAGLEEVTDFGSNPGNLQMFTYVPSGSSGALPLMVVLHGCGQGAAEMAQEAGWNELAEENGFIVLYPQQKSLNNFQRCFNWFSPEDIAKNSGEALSIKQMVEQVMQDHSINEAGIFVTGLSAGGAMTSVMIATYPELFDGGAVQSGIAYGAASSLSGGIQAMNGQVDLSPEEWAEKVQLQNPDFQANYPKVILIHGPDDAVVNVANAREIVEQWTLLHGIDPANGETVENFEGNPRVTSSAYPDSSGMVQVLRYDVDGLGHAIAVDPGEGPLQGGEEGSYAKDADFFSSYWIAKFFGLVN